MEYAKELEFAKTLAREAGLIMQKYYRVDQHVETKSDHTPVTIADKEVNQLVVERVKAEYPDYGVLGEELSWQSDREKLWVCDPIDGTPGYIYHIPISMFSLALVEDGVPKLGYTFNPWTRDSYHAVENKGAWRNGESPLRVSERRWGKDCRLGGAVQGFISEQAVKQGVKRIAGYGLVFDGCLTAEGSMDGRVFGGKGAHDIAAIKLIIEEAGGKVTDLDGNEQRYDRPLNGAIMSNGLIHNELLELVRRAKK